MASPLSLAVAALVCQILVVVFPFDFSNGPLWVLVTSDGIGVIQKIAFIMQWFSIAIAIAVAIAFIRRDALWTAGGICIGVGVIVAIRVFATIVNAFVGSDWAWRSDLVMVLDAITVVLLYLAAQAIRREAPASSA